MILQAMQSDPEIAKNLIPPLQHYFFSHPLVPACAPDTVRKQPCAFVLHISPWSEEDDGKTRGREGIRD